MFKHMHGHAVAIIGVYEKEKMEAQEYSGRWAGRTINLLSFLRKRIA
jgi:ATP-dependent Clp protease adapter protein ClpS